MSEERIKQVHFIGVGGVGMSGIARVAHDQGMQVSGSDIKESRYTKQLREAGITVFIGQNGGEHPRRRNPVVVISTAILENNPELIEARRRGLEIWHRAQMLAHLGARPRYARRGRHARQDHHVVHARQHARRAWAPTPPSSSAASCAPMAPTPTPAAATITSWRPTSPTSRSRTCLPTAVHRHQHRGRPPRPLQGPRRDLRQVPRRSWAGVPEDGVIVACGEEPHVVEIARSDGPSYVHVRL